MRGPHGEDISYFIEKVTFKLHPSFQQAVREVTSPPFEVTEKGWGEFEATIRIHFKDPNEKNVEMREAARCPFWRRCLDARRAEAFRFRLVQP